MTNSVYLRYRAIHKVLTQYGRSNPPATFDSELKRHKSSKKPSWNPLISQRVIFVPLFLAGKTANSYLRKKNDLSHSNIQDFMSVKKAILEKWVVAQKKHRLSDKHVQMARELGLNPDKLGKIDNHQQETWKAPLPQFIEEIYFKRFKRDAPEAVKPLKQIMAEQEQKKKEQKKAKDERRKLCDETGINPIENEPIPQKPLSISAKLKLINEKPKVKVKLEGGESSDSILLKEIHFFDEAFAFYEKESVTFAELGFILKKIHPRYKPRRYGCKTLRAIYEKLDKYEVVESAVCRKILDEADKSPIVNK